VKDDHVFKRCENKLAQKKTLKNKRLESGA